MTEHMARRKGDIETNRRIDGMITELNDCRQGILDLLSGLFSKVDHISEELVMHKNDVKKLANDLSGVSENLKSINDILIAWNNANGFFSVIKFFSGFVKMLAPIGIFIAMITAFAVFIYHKFD